MPMILRKNKTKSHKCGRNDMANVRNDVQIEMKVYRFKPFILFKIRTFSVNS